MYLNRQTAVDTAVCRLPRAIARLCMILLAIACWGTVRQAAAAVLSVDPLTTNIEVTVGHNADPIELRISNNSGIPGEEMPYQITVFTLGGYDWLSVSPTSGVSRGEVQTHVVTINSSNLQGRTYEGSLTVESPVAGNSPVKFKIFLRVNQKPVPKWNVEVVEPPLNVEIIEGTAVPDRMFTVQNEGSAPVGRLRYEVNLSDDLRNWVTAVTPDSGVSSGDVHTLTMQYDVAGISPGTYSGVLEVRGFDDWNGEPVGNLSTNLTLRVISHSALSVDEGQLNVSVLQDLSYTNVMKIWNSAVAPRCGMSYTIENTAPWLRFEPSSGVVQDNTASVNAIFSAGALSPGNYSVVFQVKAKDAIGEAVDSINSPRFLTANLTVVSRKPVNYEPPEVVGIPNIGRMLQAFPGLWNNMERLRFEYQWERADNVSGAGQVVAQSWSTSMVYMVTAADRGKYLRVKVRATDAHPTPLQTIAVSAYRSGKIVATPGDFDGDGRTDLWFYNPGDGYWYGFLTGGFHGRYFFGAPGMNLIPVPGDYDGNGFLDLCLYDPASGDWHAMLLPQEQYATATFGWPGAVPVPADYNGDGMSDPAIYWPDKGRWYIGNVPSWSVKEIALGGPGKQAVPADYDGDGKADVAVYNPADGKWTVRGSRVGVYEKTLGGRGAAPTAADYDGDGKADIAVYWAGANLWQISLSRDGRLRETTFGVSSGSGIPVSGYYDNDPFCDPAQAEIVDDFIVWCVELSCLTNAGIPYRGQTYQLSTGIWRVSW